MGASTVNLLAYELDTVSEGLTNRSTPWGCTFDAKGRVR